MTLLHRQGGLVDDLLQGEARLDAGDHRDAGQVVEQKALVGGQVGGDHAQQVVRFAGHQVTFHDLGPLAHRGFELGQGVAALQFQADMDQHADRKVDRALVDQGGVALDHAALLQRAHPAQAGRLRQPDLIREFDVAQAAVFLQPAQDTAVDIGEGVFWHDSSFSGLNSVNITHILPLISKFRKDVPDRSRIDCATLCWTPRCQPQECQWD